MGHAQAFGSDVKAIQSDKNPCSDEAIGSHTLCPTIIGILLLQYYYVGPTTSTKVGVCLGDRIYLYCMVHYVICDYIKLRVDLRVHPQPCVT